MKKQLFSFLCIGLMLTACGQQNKQETTMDFVDNVKVALADSGHINLDSLQWTREPAACEIKDDTIRITTAPKTDLWQRTYYHFQNDNAPVLQMKTREKFFSFVVKTDFTGSHHRFDQCGIVMYLDSENWLKGSVEYENEEFQHLGSVATNNGYSDWATTAIPADVKTMWYRFSRREDDYCIECSADGEKFSQMRIWRLPSAPGRLTMASSQIRNSNRQIGIYRMIKDIILVGIGSGIGGICRYLISLAMTQARNGFPWGTFTINVVGCLLIGILWGATSRFQNVSPSFSLFLMVGFCGGFTTFSTFSKEGLTMLQADSYILCKFQFIE